MECQAKLRCLTWSLVIFKSSGVDIHCTGLPHCLESAPDMWRYFPMSACQTWLARQKVPYNFTGGLYQFIMSEQDKGWIPILIESDWLLSKAEKGRFVRRSWKS
jgi:hypothetical protein